MPCYQPNILYAQKVPGQEKHKKLGFINGSQKNMNYEWYEKQNEWFRENDPPEIMREFMKVPCGECEGCQEAYSKEWAVRCLLEAQEHEHNYFITLTYDEYNIPRDDEIVDEKTGVIYENDNWMQGHLVKNHWRKFEKDLRRYWEYHYNHTGIRFYACGEYGGQTQRPHYHAILMNFPIPLDKLKVHSMSNGNPIFECEIIEKIWGKGFISLAEVNWDTCAYVARYVMKKQKGKMTRERYFETGKTPEFVLMSRRPGIAQAYAAKNLQNIYSNDEIIIKGHREKIQPVKPPKYYDRLFDKEHHELMEKIKEKRKAIAKEENRLKNSKTSMTEAERLKSERLIKKGKWESLKRNAI